MVTDDIGSRAHIDSSCRRRIGKDVGSLFRVCSIRFNDDNEVMTVVYCELR